MTAPIRPPETTDGESEDGAARVAIGELVGLWSQSALFMEIGLRAETLRLDPGRAFPWPVLPAPPVGGRSARPGLERLGKRLVHRLERQIEDLIAGREADDDLDRERLLGAARLACPVAAAAALAPALVAGFGLAPPIAPLAAAALCRRGALARWSEMFGRSRSEVLLAIERLALPK
ncbi:MULTISPECIES: hypothetical protein [unclassified Aureimonas]|uniref:hypothetical protein n=1 Tax=unclassified Aureimonas TaxID=2615206 RepID=UPI0006F48F94|nr:MULTISPECIES: hypothetical protein [unclassified Aureimonas]KQT69082.1 hypothetical protein ASG54_05395 [Aureimonas sp. Leaf460]KQT69320.1 hypothetical protein ASG62_18000 [Aureimonas sp. Leaf427]